MVGVVVAHTGGGQNHANIAKRGHTNGHFPNKMF